MKNVLARRISILLLIIISIIFIILSMAFMTDFNTMKLVKDNVNNYNLLQNYNHFLFKSSILAIILILILLPLGNFYREKYFIENYIGSISISLILIIMNFINLIKLNKINKIILDAINIRNKFLEGKDNSAIYGNAYTNKIVIISYVITSIFLILLLVHLTIVLIDFIKNRKDNINENKN